MKAAAMGAARFCKGLMQLLMLMQDAGDTARRGNSFSDFQLTCQRGAGNSKGVEKPAFNLLNGNRL